MRSMTHWWQMQHNSEVSNTESESNALSKYFPKKEMLTNLVHQCQTIMQLPAAMTTMQMTSGGAPAKVDWTPGLPPSCLYHNHHSINANTHNAPMPANCQWATMCRNGAQMTINDVWAPCKFLFFTICCFYVLIIFFFRLITAQSPWEAHPLPNHYPHHCTTAVSPCKQGG